MQWSFDTREKSVKCNDDDIDDGMVIGERKNSSKRKSSDEPGQFDQANWLIWAIAVQPNQRGGKKERERENRTKFHCNSMLFKGAYEKNYIREFRQPNCARKNQTRKNEKYPVSGREKSKGMSAIERMDAHASKRNEKKRTFTCIKPRHNLEQIELVQSNICLKYKPTDNNLKCARASIKKPKVWATHEDWSDEEKKIVHASTLHIHIGRNWTDRNKN